MAKIHVSEGGCTFHQKWHFVKGAAYSPKWIFLWREPATSQNGFFLNSQPQMEIYVPQLPAFHQNGFCPQKGATDPNPFSSKARFWLKGMLAHWQHADQMDFLSEGSCLHQNPWFLSSQGADQIGVCVTAGARDWLGPFFPELTRRRRIFFGVASP